MNEQMLHEAGALARKAERWGAKPQGEKLALMAQCMGEGDLRGAMVYRDEIRGALADARTGVLGLIAIGLAPVVLIALAVLFGYLVS